MTSHSTEHHSVEESPDKRVQLPSPDANNITVLTRELPNEPILPWHRFDSPWLNHDHDAETTAGTLEEFVEGSDVEIQVVDQQIIEPKVEALDSRFQDLSDASDDDSDDDIDAEGDGAEGIDAEDIDAEESEEDLEDEEPDSDAWSIGQCLDEILDPEAEDLDESESDIFDPDGIDSDAVEQSENRQEQRRVFLPEPDRSLIDPNIPVGTLPEESQAFDQELPEADSQNLSGGESSAFDSGDANDSTMAIAETPGHSGESFPPSATHSSIRMDGAVSLTGDRHESDASPDPSNSSLDLNSQDA